jgi:hypothetical protein
VRWAAILLAAVLGTLLGLVVVPAGHVGTGAAPQAARALQPGSTADPRSAARTVPPGADALAVLHRWDARRAAAWASGSPQRLRALYVRGSSTGAADVRLLRRYRSRGLRVTGMRTQVLDARVLAARPGRCTLRVTDRLASAVAVHHGRATRLPRDAAGATVVTLVHQAGVWRVARVREVSGPQVSAAPPPGATRGWGGRS